MSKPDVVAIVKLLDEQWEQLQKNFNLIEVLGLSGEARAAKLREVASTARGLVTNGGVGVDRLSLDALPSLEIVACNGVGVDAIDRAACATRNIAVTNTPDVLTADVADLALALLLASTRRIVEGDQFVRAGKWLHGGFPLGRNLTGKVAGVIGLGRIGAAIAKRCAAFDMKVAYYGPRAKADSPYKFYSDLEALATDADFLIVACPGGAATKNLVNERVLRALGKKGTLVNVSRGSVVDEAALVSLLQSGDLGAAALDVFADEPRVPTELFAMQNVVLQPHVGSGTVETRGAMGQLVVDNLVAHFAGKPLLTAVPAPQ